jgi:hypothetical protein
MVKAGGEIHLQGEEEESPFFSSLALLMTVFLDSFEAGNCISPFLVGKVRTGELRQFKLLHFALLGLIEDYGSCSLNSICLTNEKT